MKNEKNVLLLGALAGLVLMGQNVQASDAPKINNEEVKCYGVNSCKGHGVCSGKIDACSGKNNCNAELKCSGTNTCKGKGIVKLGKKECLEKGGKIASN